MMTDRVHTSRRKNCGFTLIEMVMVIIITGIIASMVAIFIRSPVEGYLSSVRRAELTDAADVALRRFARDVRLALPNSLRTTTSSSVNYIEFIMTSTGGRYRDDADGSTGGNFLYASGSIAFDALGRSSNSPPAISPGDVISPGDYIVVYNLGENYDPANAYVGGNRAQIASVPPPAPVCAPQPCTFSLSSNPFPTQSPPLPSPNSRFQVVPGSVQAVTFSCPSATLGNFTRYWNYGFQVAAPTAAPTSDPLKSALMATNATCTVSYSSSTALGRNGLLSITLTLTDPSSNESVTLFREIHVDNSP